MVPEPRHHCNAFLGAPPRKLEEDNGSHPVALIILNLNCSRELLKALWEVAQIRICADGGANRLFDIMGNSRADYIPAYVKGDLDSLREEVKLFYL